MNDIPTPVSLINAARAMKPQLRERAAQVEEARIVGRETIAEFREAGFFKILQPKSYGGYELPPEVLSDVIFEVASACGSSGWTLAVLALHQWEVQLLPEDAIADIWGDDPNVLLSSAYAPSGNVKPVDGGYELSGEWPYSSGCDHADWAIVGGVRPPRSDDEVPALCGFFVPRSEYEIIDDWNVMGLAGTGSKRIKMDGVFVPERHQHAIFGSAPPPPEDANTIYKIPFALVFVEMLSAAVHGMAMGMLDQFIERNKARLGALDQSKYSENSDIHRYIAETEFVIRSSRMLSHENQRTAFNLAEAGQEQALIDKVRHLWEAAKSVHNCSETCSKLYSVSGAHTLFEGDSLQRLFRDLQSGTMHMAFNYNAYARNYGGMHMGHPNSGSFV